MICGLTTALDGQSGGMPIEAGCAAGGADLHEQRVDLILIGPMQWHGAAWSRPKEARPTQTPTGPPRTPKRLLRKYEPPPN